MMSELKTRLKSKTPQWFKKIRAFGLWLSGTATAIAAFNMATPGIIPEHLLKLVGYAVVAGLVMSGTAHTAKEDQPK